MTKNYGSSKLCSDNKIMRYNKGASQICKFSVMLNEAKRNEASR
ncbi:hypothetical protein ACOWPH_08810 [Anabaena sp. PCC 7938]|nr:MULTISPECIES: hypothetical protein [Anabaena]